MYRFQIRAATEPGETIALVGSTPELGGWDVGQCVRLQTDRDRYPLWQVDLELKSTAPADHANPADDRAHYKYLRIRADQADQTVEWEAGGDDRWVPIEAEFPSSMIIVEDGMFGTIPPYPHGYFAEPPPQPDASQSSQESEAAKKGLKIVVLGSSVALGCSAWLLQGWAWRLGQTLQQRYGHRVVNLSQIGANVSQTIDRFNQVVAPEQPDIVIIALSLGNEGLASGSAGQQRSIQRCFEKGLQQLVQMTRAIGAEPILGGLYPNGSYTPAHSDLLRETQQRMLTWNLPVLDWLDALDDGQGRWKPGISFDAAHPNTRGHQIMYDAIDLTLFEPDRANQAVRSPLSETSLYRDDAGFEVLAYPPQNILRISNRTAHCYTITPQWQVLQTAIQSAKLPPGVYLAEATSGAVALLIQEGTIATVLDVPAAADLLFYPVHLAAGTETLFADGQLTLLKMDDRRLTVINHSEHEYNLHPMWQEVRTALKSMPPGVYEDAAHPEARFRTMMIGSDGLESRVKSLAHTAIVLDYQCPLSEISRVAILPLGDRCAARMLLYKLEYDGPAFPFDLTRSTNLADVADILQNDFEEMWNPALLHYSHEARRIYHTRWTGLSFAHEVEDSDDPVQDMSPVYRRMQTRYSARANRFRYTLQTADKFLFVRTGLCDRSAVIDLLQKLEARCQGKPFRLLLISPQPSDEFADLPSLLHYNLEFNPDRMYADLGHWLYCTEVMRDILDSLGVSSKNLFWCPPNVSA